MSRTLLPFRLAPALTAGLLGLVAAAGCIGGIDDGPPPEHDSDLYVNTSFVWKDPRIPVCWVNPSPEHAQAMAWTRDAVINSWEAVSAVRFYGWAACPPVGPDTGRGVRIKIDDVQPRSTIGAGSLFGGDESMWLNFTFANFSTEFCTGRKEFCIRAIAIHEFGHALGFNHEQDRPDSPDWCKGDAAGSQGSTIGPWDTASVMNYCNPHWNGDGHLSPTDIQGVQQVYGTSAQLPPGTLLGIGNRCLDQAGYGTAAGTGAILWDCHRQWNQMWTIDPTASSLGAVAGRPLEAVTAGPDFGNGTLLQLGETGGGARQSWQLDGVEVIGLAERVFDVNTSVNAGGPGAPVYMWDAHGGANQKWTFAADGTVRGYQGRCLASNGTQAGAALVMQDCNAQRGEQQFRLRRGGYLQHATGLCVDVFHSTAERGVALILWQCHGGPNQRFRTRGPIRGPGNRCLDDPAAGATNGSRVHLWDCHGGANQVWEYFP